MLVKLDVVGKLLRGVDDFIGVGTVVVEHARRWFDLDLCVVILCTAAGAPLLTLDNALDLSDAQRRRYVSRILARNPLYPAVVARHAPAISDDQTVVLLPIFNPDGLLGVIHCTREQSFTVASCLDLSVFATLVSVRLNELGITTSSERATLSERQSGVARLAARGLQNHQIAMSLGISENTVKKHLKDVFVRLRVSNRTELVPRLAQVGSAIEWPLGITRTGTVVITRGTW